MSMSSFDKDMNIIQKLNDEPNDRDGLTAGELKAKFDEGGLAVKGYLNNTVRPYVNGLDNDKYDKTGGTLSGNVIVVQDDAVAPSLQLKGQEKSGEGRAVTTINKNASAASDGGTQIIDWNWGSTDQFRLIVQATAAALKEKVRLYYKEGSASAVTYYLYGTHNPPAVADVTGLPAALAAGAGALTAHAANTGNPHSVTAAQVGLGNVPNVSTNDQTPTYTAASSNTALASGEKLSVAFGKIAKAISSLISHLANTTVHITASERTTWNGKQNALTFDNSPTSGSANPVKSGGVYTALGDKFDKAGGTVSGNVSIQRSDSGMSSMHLISAEKENVGRARTVLQKNASATTDSGTILFDYSWGYSSTTHPHARLYLNSSAATLKELLYLYRKPESGSAVTYYLYGTHNPPGIADVTGLQTDFYVTAGKKSGTTLGTKATAEGKDTTASGKYSHAEGEQTVASGDYSYSGGLQTIANHAGQHVFGKWNVEDGTASPTTLGTYVEIVGNGGVVTRKNARTLDWSGNEWIAGTLTQASDARLKDVQGDIPDVSGIRAVKFRWNDQKGEHDEKDHIGYLAQDVEQVAPYLVGEDSSGYKSLDYIAFLCAKIEGLERRVAELESR